MSSEDRARYYDYEPTTTGSKWWVKDVPVAEPWFQEGLNAFAGLSDRGQPNLRLVWGGNQLSDITHQPSLKYKVVREITHGYNYVTDHGTIRWVASMNLAKDAKVPWEFVPKKERIDLGRLRWIIEKHVPAHELRRLGRFSKVHAPDGERILRDLPEEGVYDCFFVIQTAAHKYRDPDREVLMAVEAMYRYNTTNSEAQQALDAIERQKEQTLITGAEARAVWQGL